jgi:hypothetical protein
MTLGVLLDLNEPVLSEVRYESFVQDSFSGKLSRRLLHIRRLTDLRDEDTSRGQRSAKSGDEVIVTVQDVREFNDRAWVSRSRHSGKEGVDGPV